MSPLPTVTITREPLWQAWWRTGRLSQHLLLLACAAGVAGLLASRALIALSPVVGVLAALANPRLKTRLPRWWRLRTVWGPAALYALLLLSGLYTQDWAAWRHELFRQLPWLGVPLAFGLAVPLSPRQRFGVGLLYVGGAALIGAATMGQYFLDPVTANAAFGSGQSMPSVTRVFHIHFGLMLALAAFFGVALRREPWAGAVLRAVITAAAATCVLTLHVLAYRTGLMVFYGALLLEALLLLFIRRRVWLGGLLLLALAVAPYVAYQSLESVRQRVEATSYDIEQFQRNNDINEYSLSRRLAAWQTALVVARQQLVLGVGPADAYHAMMEQYDWQNYGLRPENRVMIHNQYLHQLVGGGIVGLALWLLVLFGPLTQPRLRRNPYVYRFVLLQALAMSVDSLLELQTSFNLFVFLYGFLLVATERRITTKTLPTATGSSSIFV
ncbi:O-antigen ligase family protein [Hymenobacter sp. HSC-4F20]|uniref:O-antigen ligase family protein n=1 Tax=Hymenobacter sp. HSC-4F20 TaxID=2864135 RepID=UPI001C72F3C4|nr:O-antigen ligase family protein [Hymenobacter sp. HSC-4F20]MBX0291246.1 O-antigen ligase family protein [Hymenobacter sp. HSC-4F20]